MRNKLAFLVALLIAASFVSGCSSAEKKFGRGIRNTTEIVRMGELRRSMEQNALAYGPSYGRTTGFVSGFNRTLARTGIGIYEIVTAPFPPYDPVATHYLSPNPQRPDNNPDQIFSDSLYATDSNLGFSGGGVAPMIPGSRFRIFDTP